MRTCCIYCETPIDSETFQAVTSYDDETCFHDTTGRYDLDENDELQLGWVIGRYYRNWTGAVDLVLGYSKGWVVVMDVAARKVRAHLTSNHGNPWHVSTFKLYRRDSGKLLGCFATYAKARETAIEYGGGSMHDYEIKAPTTTKVN